MGRLTLNVLLGFAQFEREVIGERARDKIAASKRKGMWMGGNVPLRSLGTADSSKPSHVGNRSKYLVRLSRLNYLAPDIGTSIIEGRQPASLNARRLVRISELPIAWSDQRKLLGFA